MRVPLQEITDHANTLLRREPEWNGSGEKAGERRSAIDD